jgi:DNA-binding protein HU-beta
MHTTDLIERIAADHELSKAQARRVIEAVFGAIIETAAQGDEVALSGFGRFKVAERAARQGRNPATGETIAISASRKLAFSAAKAVRDQLNGQKTGAGKAKARQSARAAASAIRSGSRRVVG